MRSGKGRGPNLAAAAGIRLGKGPAAGTRPGMRPEDSLGAGTLAAVACLAAGSRTPAAVDTPAAADSILRSATPWQFQDQQL
jgi:hypothetical protein